MATPLLVHLFEDRPWSERLLALAANLPLLLLVGLVATLLSIGQARRRT